MNRIVVALVVAVAVASGLALFLGRGREPAKSESAAPEARSKGSTSPAVESPAPSRAESTPPSSPDSAPAPGTLPTDLEIRAELDAISDLAAELDSAYVSDIQRRLELQKEIDARVEALGRFGRRSLDPLRAAALASPNVLGLRTFLGAWLRYFPEDAIPSLRVLALDPSRSPVLRTQIALQLVTVVPEATVELVDRMLLDPGLRAHEGRFALLSVLERTADPRAAQPLLRVLEDPTEAPTARLQAGQSLAAFRTAEVIATLERLSREEPLGPLRVRAFQSLYSILGCTAAPFARELLREPSLPGGLKDLADHILESCP